jgi:MFS family permease
VAGAFGPIFVSTVTIHYNGVLGWKIVFFIMTLFSMIAIILWKLFIKAEVDTDLNRLA